MEEQMLGCCPVSPWGHATAGASGVLEVGAETHILGVFWCWIFITIHESLT